MAANGTKQTYFLSKGNILVSGGEKDINLNL